MAKAFAVGAAAAAAVAGGSIAVVQASNVMKSDPAMNPYWRAPAIALVGT